MQAYGAGFARIYNIQWISFAKDIAPRILDAYERSRIGAQNKSILDLCCGTGQLAHYFLEHGYTVTGIDLSEAMLDYACENNRAYVEKGQAKFIQGDASGFSLAERFGLVVSTYDALNHLENDSALDRCFHCVFNVLADDGQFIFDLNTRAGLMRWNSVNVADTSDAMIVTRGIYDGVGPRAYTKISGFVPTEEGHYERFDETAFNTVFEMQAVKKMLLDTGWRHVYFARTQDLATPIADPEKEGRVFIVANK